MSGSFEPGEEIAFPYPFVREEYHDIDADGPFTSMTWRPGTRAVPVAPDGGEMVADGMGEQIITIVSLHKPGNYPMRVFFTRRWRDPKGNEFGTRKLRMTTAAALRALCRGFRHDYRLAEAA